MFRRTHLKRGRFEHFYQQSFKVYFYKIGKKNYFFIFFIEATNIKMGNFEALTENGKYVVKREKYRTGYIQESMATPPCKPCIQGQGSYSCTPTHTMS